MSTQIDRRCLAWLLSCSGLPVCREHGFTVEGDPISPGALQRIVASEFGEPISRDESEGLIEVGRLSAWLNHHAREFAAAQVRLTDALRRAEGSPDLLRRSTLEGLQRGRA